ncbi:hypothetical protein WJX74_009387 [Apatococcus lobatus]|uniref:Uncharacterized protein n=2 Tax=Apatococcus TaxID=904362 RepID=A0AAW1SBT3_9CHLO
MPLQPPSQLGVGVDRSLEGVLADVFDDSQTAHQMAGGWPRLTKTPEGHGLHTAGTGMTAEEQRAYDAAVAKASSWLSAAEDDPQQQPPTQSLPGQSINAQQHHLTAQPDDYASRLEQLRMAAAQPGPAVAAPVMDQQGRSGAGLQPIRQPSWGNEASLSQQSSPHVSRGAPNPALQWGSASSKSPPLGPKGRARRGSGQSGMSSGREASPSRAPLPPLLPVEGHHIRPVPPHFAVPSSAHPVPQEEMSGWAAPHGYPETQPLHSQLPHLPHGHHSQPSHAHTDRKWHDQPSQEWQPQYSRSSSQGYAQMAPTHSRSPSTHRWALPSIAPASHGTQSAPHLRPPPMPVRKTPAGGPATAPGMANFGSLPPPRRGSVGVSANPVVRQQSLSAAQQAANRGAQFESSLRQDGTSDRDALPSLESSPGQQYAPRQRQQQQQHQQQQGRNPPHPGLISAANPKRAARLASRSFYAKSTASDATNHTEVQSLPGNPPPAEAVNPMGWMMPPPGMLMMLPDGSMFMSAPPPLQQQARQQRSQKLASMRGRLAKQPRSPSGSSQHQLGFPAQQQSPYLGAMWPNHGLPPLMVPMMPQIMNVPLQSPSPWPGVQPMMLMGGPGGGFQGPAAGQHQQATATGPGSPLKRSSPQKQQQQQQPQPQGAAGWGPINGHQMPLLTQDVRASHGSPMPISDVYLRAAYMMQQQQMALLQSSLNGSMRGAGEASPELERIGRKTKKRIPLEERPEFRTY